MMNSCLFSVIEESSLSPEEFGKFLGISGMSLRRWITKDAKATVAKAYRPVVREAVYELIANGKLSGSSAAVQEILRDEDSFQTKAALRNLGISKDFLKGNPGSDQMLSGLCEIGIQEEKQNEVSQSQQKIFSFQTLGEDWKKRISILWTVVQSKEITKIDKMVAFGALFYLITPIDFIPDHIPFFGLLDDMAVLGIAANYYLRKFDKIA